MNLPGNVDVAGLRRDLEQLAGDLMVELHVAEALGAKAPTQANATSR